MAQEELTIPGPKLKALIDKTAGFVAKNGKKIEAKILMRGEEKFGFIKAGHVFNPYYLDQVENLAVKIHKEQTKSSEEKSAPVTQRAAQMNPTFSKIQAEPKTQKEPEKFKYLVKHPDLYDPTSEMTSEGLEILKLTAQYAAIQGVSFLEKVSNQEKHNRDFAFLDTNNKHHAYFLKLMNAYVDLVDPDNREVVLAYIDGNYSSKFGILQRAVHRVEFEKTQELDRVEKLNQDREQTTSFLQIDWHDFVVVDTITYDSVEEVQDKPEKVKPKAEVREVSMESSSESESEDESSKKRIKVVTDYEPRVKVAESREKMVVLPSGERVSAEGISHHVRLDLVDPEALEHKRKFEERRKNAPFSQKDISSNLKNLAEKRPDVFGK